MSPHVLRMLDSLPLGSTHPNMDKDNEQGSFSSQSSQPSHPCQQLLPSDGQTKMAAPQEYRSQLDATKVLVIYHMKQTNTPSMHESVIIKIDFGDGYKWYLRFERFADQYTPTGQHMSFRVGSLESTKTRPALDCVSMVSEFPSCETIVEEVDVGKYKINLLDIAQAAWVVRSNNQQYNIFNTQCYWFAGTIMELLKKAFGFDEDGSSPELAKSYPNGGQWNCFTLYKRDETQIVAFTEKFHQEREKVHHKISQAQKRRDAEYRARLQAAEERGRKEGREETQKLQAKEELEKSKLADLQELEQVNEIPIVAVVAS
ncbi:hypothetical protein BU17DRAFT_84830 [Hysterangium stoloniferum]|nr:hypothetical protein BU17DRAFT_84830 [Hysterangium stoloniferum]